MIFSLPPRGGGLGWGRAFPGSSPPPYPPPSRGRATVLDTQSPINGCARLGRWRRFDLKCSGGSAYRGASFSTSLAGRELGGMAFANSVNVGDLLARARAGDEAARDRLFLICRNYVAI